MYIAGIIAEFNPFHNGHKYLVDTARKNGATHIAAVMSGAFVQRGEPALLPKDIRAAAAIDCGVDLVVELPVQYAVSPANIFAKAGVFILNNLSCDAVCFGSESGNAAELSGMLDKIKAVETSDEIKQMISSGMSYPRALSEAVTILYGEKEAAVLSGANNTLALEYIRAIKELNSNMKPLTIKRTGAAHDSDKAGNDIASASLIRSIIKSEDAELIKKYLPFESYSRILAAYSENNLLISDDIYSRLCINKLRMLTPSQAQELPDVSEGLQNRIIEAAKKASSIAELCELAKTKRYTMARIRRIIACALLDITKDDRVTLPSYIRVLAMNKNGKEILARAKAVSKIPIGVKMADLYKLSPHNINLSVNSEEIYSLCLPKVRQYGADFTNRIYIKK